MQDSRYTTQAADYRRFFVNGRTLALALGYGLFRGANSLLYSSALASVPTSTLFIADMSFSMTTALSSLLCALAVMALAWKGLILGFRLPVVLPALLLLLVAAPAVAPWIAPGSSGVFVLLALTYGVASTCLNLSWLEVVAHQTPARIAGILALGMLVKSVITLACGSLMGVPFVVAVGVLLVGAVALLLRARGRAWLDSSEDDAAPATFKRIARARWESPTRWWSRSSSSDGEHPQRVLPRRRHRRVGHHLRRRAGADHRRRDHQRHSDGCGHQPGNSGGALFDSYGNVVGIVYAKSSSVSIEASATPSRSTTSRISSRR